MGFVHLQDSLDASIARVLSSIRSLRGIKASLVRSPDGPLIHTRIQTIFNVKHSCALDSLIHEIVMVHAIQAERRSPGGFDRCLEMLLKGFSWLEQGDHICDVLKRLEANVSEPDLIPSQSDVDWLLDVYLQDVQGGIREMLDNAITLAGFNGNVFVERAAADIASIELVRGYSFKLEPSIPVTTYLESPRIFCIDGYIEEVSEIHHLLEAAFDSKDSIVMFVRGMSDDVRHTLKVNFDRGSLRVVPVTVQFDFEGINTLADICAVTGADLTSSDKGDLISSIDFASAPVIEKASIFPTRVVLHERSTHVAVNIQAEKIRHRKAEAEHDVQARLFDERLRSLTPNHVSIRLLDDRNFVQNSQAIDYVLRAFRSLLGHGTCTINGKKLLMATAIAGSVHAQRCLETLFSAGAAMIISKSDPEHQIH